MSILKLTKANCRNCYKCVRNCPIKSIEVKDHQAQIIERDCILCGSCILTCPQNAKQVRNDLDKTKNLIRSGDFVVASVAPSFISSYNVSDFEFFRKILIKLGFSDASETAVGAYLVKSRYEEMIKNHEKETIISSCCPTVVKLIQKYHTNAFDSIAPVMAPMQTHAKLIKQKNPAARVVFIGPCISKKDESESYPGLVDMVLTFDELDEWLDENKIELTGCSTNPDAIENKNEKYLSRFFPVSGGIIKSMNTATDYRYISVDGLDNCINALNEIEKGDLKKCFIEMSACSGGCINGPTAGRHKKNLLAARIKVEDWAVDKKKHLNDFKIKTDIGLGKVIEKDLLVFAKPSEAQIAGILKKMGKSTLSDELNCGTCGYHTCRDKAIAVFFGKAEISMCLPYMKNKAESFSDAIISATPNGIIVVDTDLKIQQINNTALNIFGLSDDLNLIGTPISRLMSEFDYVQVIADEKSADTRTVYLVEYGKYLEQTLLFDKGSSIVICIIKDITKKQLKREGVFKAKSNAESIAYKIVEKQMCIVHEIASLLGETTAETRIALTELTNTLLLEDEDY